MTMVRRRLAGLVAATLVAAAGLVGLSSAPAAAAFCSGSGVNVVVDFNGLGGGVQKGCDPSGANKNGSKVFPAAGFSLTYAQRQAGFVCRVNGSPSSDPCQNTAPANAYWGLYWSNGRSGKWTYSSSGVGGTSVPNGGFLAFSWQNGGSADPPGAAPVNNKPAPAPKPQPTKKATKAPAKQGTNQGTKQSDSGSGSTSANAPEQTTPDQPTKTQGAETSTKKKAAKAKAQAKRARASKRAKASSSASASRSASESAAPEASDDASPDVSSAEQVDSAFAPDDEQGGLPVWVPVVVILALAGSAGGAAWWRRRTGTP